MKEVFNKYSHGKFLLTSEYFVTKGSLSLALPLNRGQKIRVKEGEVRSPQKYRILNFKSINELNEVYYGLKLCLETFSVLETNDLKKTDYLLDILKKAKEMSTTLFSSHSDYEVTIKSDFPLNWGLGSSSTLINNIASWAKVDPFELYFSLFNGSGYDIACAVYSSPITYKLINKKPFIEVFKFYPDFSKNLYFVYLNKKVDSNKEISRFNEYVNKVNDQDFDKNICYMSELTEKIINSKTINEFISLIEEHERFLSSILNEKRVKEKLFPDFWGEIKSLGAWGGDFVLVASNDEDHQKVQNYFYKKGHLTFFKYNELVKTK